MDNSAPNQPPRPAYDPGWNDPPKFTYNPNDAAPKVKLNLNKRVAFPMAQSPGAGPSASRKTELAPSGLPMPHSKNGPPLMMPTQSSSGPAADLPPPPSVTPSLPPMGKPSVDAPEAALEKLTLEDLTPKATTAIEFLITVARDNSLEDICVRLDQCRKEIASGSLSPAVLQLIVRIHEELSHADTINTHSALQCQQLLMVNHIQQCSLWGPAIKRAIGCLEKINPAEDEQHKQPTIEPPVQYFKPASVEVEALSPPSLPEQITAQQIPSAQITPTVENPAVASTEVSSPVAAEQSTSIFQKLKSRILHV